MRSQTAAALGLRLCLAVTFLSTVAAQGQRDTPIVAPPGQALISGVVVSDDAASRPLRRVLVTLNGGDVVNLQAITDDNGRFTFRGVRAGRYTLRADRPGYVVAFYGATAVGRAGTAIAVKDGQQIGNLTIRMMRGSVITGMLTTETGEPSRETRVSVMTYGFSRMTGERVLMGSGPGVATDDRGMYRVFGLAPGDYVIIATPVARGAGARQIAEGEYQRALAQIRSGTAAASVMAAAPSQSLGNAPVFFPGTPIAADAQMVTLGRGEERSSVNFTVRPVRISRIDGTVTGPDGQPAPNVAITVISPDRIPGPLGAPPARPVTDRDGKFTVANLTPGRYSLVARTATPPGGRGAPATGAAPPLYAIADVTTDGRDASVSMTLRPGVTVSGTLTFESSGVQPAPTDLSRVRIMLEPAILSGVPIALMPSGTPDARGAFSFSGVTPGQYRLTITVPGSTAANPAWVIKATGVGGRDLTAAPFEVASDDLTGIQIAMSDRPTELSGLMQDAAGQPAPEYFLIAFPQDPALQTSTAGRIQQVRPDADGRFIFRALPPGAYFLGALTDVQPGEWFDRTFLQRLAGSAIRITLAEGEKKVQDIRVK